jgi:hypothetical protein
MNNKELKQERRLLNRLVISHNDLVQARWYAYLILSKKLHYSDKEEDKYLHRGLNTALIVTYYRPFSKNKDNDSKREQPFRINSDFFTAEE